MATAAALFLASLLLAQTLAQTPAPPAAAAPGQSGTGQSSEEAQARQAVAAQPNDIAARFNLALALSLEQKDEEAVKEYRRALELQPGLYEANLNLGILLLRDHKAEDALDVLKAAAESKPKEVRPAFFYAEALLAAGSNAEAAAQYQTVLVANPQSAPAELGLGRALLAQSQLPEALQHIRAAIALDPRDRPVLLDIAAALEKDNQLNDAIAIYREFPENASVQQHVGNLLKSADNFAAAIPPLEAAVKSNPTPANRMALADAYRLNHQTAPALAQLQQAAAADPNNFDLRMMYGKILRDDHKLLPAADQFYAAAKSHPDDAHPWKELASVLIIAADYPNGIAALDRVRALHAEGPGDLFFRAISLDHLHLLKPARDAYQQFLAAAAGKFPDDEFKARQRVRIIENELNRTR